MIDVDKAREIREAARREAEEKGPVVKINGKEFELDPEMPYEVVEAMKGMSSMETAGGALADIIPALLGEEAFAEFKKLEPRPTLEDVNILVHGLMAEYGVESPLVS